MSHEDREQPSPTLIALRKQWFERYCRQLDEHSVMSRGDGPYRCPCCGYRTLDERGGYEICDVCEWEDDGQDDEDADVIRGGPNYELSLTAARLNFKRIGAKAERYLARVRPPCPDEL